MRLAGALPAEGTSGPSSMDSGFSPIAALPFEGIAAILEWLGPRSLKRFGATCRSYLQASQWFFGQPEYSLMLVRSARARLTSTLVDGHRECHGGNEDELRAKADRFAATVAATLSMHTHGAGWTPPHSLQFLYPMAVTAHHDWPLAPYALEWCAFFERKILTGGRDLTPRGEILALLHKDSLDRLAAAAKCMGWDMGVTLATTAAAACSTVTPATERTVIAVMHKLAKAAVASATDGQLVFCLAALAAIDGRLSAPGCHRQGAWTSLWKVALKISRPNDDAWFRLAGMAGEKRSPAKLMGEFNCHTGGSQGRGGGGIGTLLSELIRLADLHPTVVNVPNILLPAILAYAAVGGDLAGGDQAAEDDMPDAEDDMPDLEESPPH